jgi:asparagine N-glycosylation enzyme membrane subunit Stt3
MNLKDISLYATILSVIGVFLVASADQPIRLLGFSVWVMSNFIWIIYFYKTKQRNPSILFLIYLISSFYGIINNW